MTGGGRTDRAVDQRTDEDRALELAYRFINRRERTIAEVRARLERAELGGPAIDAAVAELCEYGYLDDARYARVFVQDKRTLEDWGRERLTRTLAARGIDADLIGMALDAGGADGAPAPSEHDRAVAVLRRRFPAGPADLRERERALGVLVRKGYDSDTAYGAVRAWAGGPDAE